jgi:hypothetical protein
VVRALGGLIVSKAGSGSGQLFDRPIRNWDEPGFANTKCDVGTGGMKLWDRKLRVKMFN